MYRYRSPYQVMPNSQDPFISARRDIQIGISPFSARNLILSSCKIRNSCHHIENKSCKRLFKPHVRENIFYSIRAAHLRCATRIRENRLAFGDARCSSEMRDVHSREPPRIRRCAPRIRENRRAFGDVRCASEMRAAHSEMRAAHSEMRAAHVRFAPRI